MYGHAINHDDVLHDLRGAGRVVDSLKDGYLSAITSVCDYKVKSNLLQLDIKTIQAAKDEW
jgi:hypothetical protein